MLSRRVAVVALFSLSVSAGGCMRYLHYVSFGLIPMSGVIQYENVGGGPPSTGPKTNPAVHDVICEDAFDRDPGQGRTVLGSRAGSYRVACSYQGAALPWTVLGQFHAAPAANGAWGDYRSRVMRMAADRRCPAVAIRTQPPTRNQEGEALGAFCVSS